MNFHYENTDVNFGIVRVRCNSVELSFAAVAAEADHAGIVQASVDIVVVVV